MTNASVRPGTTQVCHKQVGGTGREREGAHRTTQVRPKARPPTHAQLLTLLQKDIRHKVQTPVSAQNTHKQMHAKKTHPQLAHTHPQRHNTRVRHMAEISLLKGWKRRRGGCPDVLQMPNNRETR